MNRQFVNVQELIEKAGSQILTYFGTELVLDNKSMASDFRTKADLESEEIIIKALQTYFPQYNIFSEEKGLIDNKSEYTFIIDPLDGTNNFVLGIPLFSVTISLIKNDTILFAATHNPFLKQTYYAEAKKGAYLGKKKMMISKEVNIANATIAITNGYAVDPKWTIGTIKKLYAKKVKRVLTNWSPALEYGLLANGKIEAIINYENEIYDFMAGKLLVQEAGGLITYLNNSSTEDIKNTKFIATNNTKLRDTLLTLLH